jgi:hypothetical protein
MALRMYAPPLLALLLIAYRLTTGNGHVTQQWAGSCATTLLVVSPSTIKPMTDKATSGALYSSIFLLMLT